MATLSHFSRLTRHKCAVLARECWRLGRSGSLSNNRGRRTSGTRDGHRSSDGGGDRRRAGRLSFLHHCTVRIIAAPEVDECLLTRSRVRATLSLNKKGVSTDNENKQKKWLVTVPLHLVPCEIEGAQRTIVSVYIVHRTKKVSSYLCVRWKRAQRWNTSHSAVSCCCSIYSLTTSSRSKIFAYCNLGRATPN